MPPAALDAPSRPAHRTVGVARIPGGRALAGGRWSMQAWFIGAVEAPLAADRDDPEQHRWFVFREGELLVDQTAPEPRLLDGCQGWELRERFLRQIYLGQWEGRHAWAAELPATDAPPSGLAGMPLRALYDRFGEQVYTLAGRAAQLLAWDRDHRYCGRCGAPTVSVPGERARRCETCRLDVYPRLSPAIIVLIERDGKILLARGRAMPPNRYGVVAGFVEPGESLEEAVRREVDEEVGLAVGDIQYFSSQPWPFPNTLMIGFTARHARGEIDLRDGELAEANWFGPDELPLVPPRYSIARRLLDAWAARRGFSIDQP